MARPRGVRQIALLAALSLVAVVRLDTGTGVAQAGPASFRVAASSTSTPVTLEAGSLDARGLVCAGAVTYVPPGGGTPVAAVEWDIAAADVTGATMTMGGTPSVASTFGVPTPATAGTVVIYAESVDATVGGSAFHDDASAATHGCPVASGGDATLTGVVVAAVAVSAQSWSTPALDTRAG